MARRIKTIRRPDGRCDFDLARRFVKGLSKPTLEILLVTFFMVYGAPSDKELLRLREEDKKNRAIAASGRVWSALNRMTRAAATPGAKGRREFKKAVKAHKRARQTLERHEAKNHG